MKRCGINDVKITEETARDIGLAKASVIKTTKIYTGSKTKLGSKICDLPESIKKEFITKYQEYQNELINKFSQ